MTDLLVEFIVTRHTGLQFMVDPGADASVGGMVGEFNKCTTKIIIGL